MAAWRYEISLLVLKKYFTRSLLSLVKYFSKLEEKFRITTRPCNMLYVLHEISVFKALAHVKRTATCPDDLPFWFWKEYALELTPVITHIVNVSLVSQQVPKIWKTANVRPVPKETNIFNISVSDQLRPISVTDIRRGSRINTDSFPKGASKA